MRGETPAEAAARLGIKWEEPPAKKRKLKHPWLQWASVLRMRPGHWAMLKEFPGKTSANSAARQPITGKVDGIKPEEFEFMGIANDDGKGSKLYGRYLGELKKNVQGD